MIERRKQSERWINKSERKRRRIKYKSEGTKWYETQDARKKCEKKMVKNKEVKISANIHAHECGGDEEKICKCTFKSWNVGNFYLPDLLFQ